VNHFPYFSFGELIQASLFLSWLALNDDTLCHFGIRSQVIILRRVVLLVTMEVIIPPKNIFFLFISFLASSGETAGKGGENKGKQAKVLVNQHQHHRRQLKSCFCECGSVKIATELVSVFQFHRAGLYWMEKGCTYLR
jgi:hypothetical protein